MHLPKKKKNVKLTYCDYPNKSVEYPDLRNTKNWDKNNTTFTTFSQ